MADDAKDLKIKIATTADVTGATQTEAALGKVNKTADDLGGNSKSASSGLDSLSNSANAAGGSAGKASDATKDLTQNVKNVAAPTRAARDIFDGLNSSTQGGTQGLLGMGRALKGVFEVLRVANPFGPLITGLAIVATAFVVLKDKVVDLIKAQGDAANDKASKDLADRAVALKAHYTELETAAKSSLDAQISKIKETSDAFTELIGKADEARARFDKLNDAQTKLRLARVDQSEAAGLASAQTDDERSAVKTTASRQRDDIRSQAEGTNLDNEQLKAKQDIVLSERTLAVARAQLEGAQHDVGDAKKKAGDATGQLDEFDKRGGNVDSKEARDLRDAAREANEELKLQKNNLDKVAEALKPVIEAAQKRIDKSNDVLEVTPFLKKTLDTGNATRGITQSAQDKAAADARQKKIDDLGQQADAAAASGDFEGQDSAVDARNKLLRQAAAEKNSRATNPLAAFGANTSTSKNTIQVGGGALPDDKLAPLDTKPVEDGTKQFAEQIQKVQATSQEAIKTTGDNIAALPPPPALDLTPVSTGFENYHDQNMEAHQASQKRINDLEKGFDRLSQQLGELARSSRN